MEPRVGMEHGILNHMVCMGSLRQVFSMHLYLKSMKGRVGRYLGSRGHKRAIHYMSKHVLAHI